MTQCPEMVDNFYYKPMYSYICKKEAGMTANAYDVLYNLFVEKIIEIFPKADDWIIFIKPDDVKEDIHLLQTLK